MLNGKDTMIRLIVGLIKKTSKNEWIWKVKVELDLFNYATKTDLKNATKMINQLLIKKTYLANLISDADKLDIDKLKHVLI